MARTCEEKDREESRLISHQEDKAGEHKDEDEALSLCDFPVNVMRDECLGASPEPAEDPDIDFDFESLNRAGSGSVERVAMSTADELFFQGRILPLRHSVSSDSGLTRRGSDPAPDPIRRLSRSESVDFRRSGSFVGGQSRSSSCRSHNSSNTTGAASISGCDCGPEPKIINNFMNNTHPSPQPQIRRASSMNGRVSTSRNPRFSIWDFLRLSLVRAPEIELQDLKARSTNRSSVSRNSSCSSTTATTSSSSNKISQLTIPKTNELDHPKQRKQRLGFGGSNRKLGFSFSNCKFSAKATAETAPLQVPEEEMAEKMKKKKEKKKALSRYRTAEWLKGLSHESFAGQASSA